MFEFDLITLLLTGSFVYTVGDGVGEAAADGACVALAGKELSSASKHFFLCSFSCLGILTSLVLHSSVGTSLHSYEFCNNLVKNKISLDISLSDCVCLFSIYLELDILALVGNFWFAAGCMLNFTSHFGYHLVLFYINVVIIGNVFSIFTSDFGNFEVNLFWDQFAFSPGDWLTSFVSSPYLFAVFIGFPFGNAVLFGNVSTFWHHFGMLDNVHTSGTNLFLG